MDEVFGSFYIYINIVAIVIYIYMTSYSDLYVNMRFSSQRESLCLHLHFLSVLYVVSVYFSESVSEHRPCYLG